MAETAETVNSIRGQGALKNVPVDVADLRNVGSMVSSAKHHFGRFGN